MGKLQKTGIAAAVFLLVAVAAVILGGRVQDGGSLPAGISEKAGGRIQNGDPVSFPARVNEEGPVSVSIRPLMSSLAADGPWEFEVVMSTHSVDLDTDVMRALVLVDASGKEYAPLGWEGDPPEGHHRETVVSFGAAETADSLTVLARDIGGVPTRTFLWTTRP